MKQYTRVDVERRIHTEGFFEAVIASVEDWNALLAQRDDERFDTEWCSSYQALLNIPYRSLEDEEAAARFREHVFKKVFALTGSSEVSGYISDDFGLIMDAVLKVSNNAWASLIFSNYIEGVFPH